MKARIRLVDSEQSAVSVKPAPVKTTARTMRTFNCRALARLISTRLIMRPIEYQGNLNRSNLGRTQRLLSTEKNLQPCKNYLN